MSKNWTVIVTDEDGQVHFETSIATLQREVAEFGEVDRVSAKDLSEAVADELGGAFYNQTNQS